MNELQKTVLRSRLWVLAERMKDYEALSEKGSALADAESKNAKGVRRLHQDFLSSETTRLGISEPDQIIDEKDETPPAPVFDVSEEAFRAFMNGASTPDVDGFAEDVVSYLEAHNLLSRSSFSKLQGLPNSAFASFPRKDDEEALLRYRGEYIRKSVDPEYRYVFYGQFILSKARGPYRRPVNALLVSRLEKIHLRHKNGRTLPVQAFMQNVGRGVADRRERVYGFAIQNPDSSL